MGQIIMCRRFWLTIAMIICVTTLMTTVLDVTSVSSDTISAINRVMTQPGRGANTLNTSPKYCDSPDACIIIHSQHNLR